MDEALIKLLEEKDYEYITVKEICKKAGVNRSTFYLHYETMSDLLAEAMEYNTKRFTEHFPDRPCDLISEIATLPLEDLIFISSDYLTPYLNFVKDNMSVFKAAYKNPECLKVEKQLKDISKYIIFPIMRRFHIPENEQGYILLFYVKGCMGIIQEWLRRDCKDPIEDIEKMIIDCVCPNRKVSDIYEQN